MNENSLGSHLERHGEEVKSFLIRSDEPQKELETGSFLAHLDDGKSLNRVLLFFGRRDGKHPIEDLGVGLKGDLTNAKESSVARAL